MLRQLAEKWGWRWQLSQPILGRWTGRFVELSGMWAVVEFAVDRDSLLMFMRGEDMVGWYTGQAWLNRSQAFHAGQTVNGKLLTSAVTAIHSHWLIDAESYRREFLSTPRHKRWAL